MVTREQAGFMGPWTQIPSPEFERSFMQYHWAQRANWSAERWSLDLGIYPAGHDAPVGAMSMIAGDFARMRSAETGSWLLPEWRGQGLGREAREAMLHLLFEGLGAREARSSRAPGQRSLARGQPRAGLPRRRHAADARGRRRAGHGDPPPPHPRALAPADRRRARGLGGVQAAVRAP